MSEGGLSTVVAAEISPFELVGLEFRLPDVGIPLRTKAWVRHQSALRHGLEFTGLSLQQRSLLRYWLQRCPEYAASENFQTVTSEPKPYKANTRSFLHLFSVLGIMIAVLSLALAGWYWQTQWTNIESNLPALQEQENIAKPIVIPSVEVEKLAIHQVDPVYPEAARRSNISGIVKLRVVVEKDGTVSSVMPLSGPAVFQPAAVDAMRWWRFKPYLVNGRTVRLQTTLGVEFRP